jgi:hypothetical protein
MWETVKKHWIVATLGSVVLSVVAIVYFFAGLAGIWAVMSKDTVPEFLAHRGWTLTGWPLSAPPWMAIFVMVVAVAILLGQIGLLKQAYTQRVYESGRVDRETLAQRENERDQAVEALQKKKEEFALHTLERCSGYRYEDGGKPTVTIRFYGYGQDYELVERTKHLIAERLHWDVAVDGGNVPALPQAEKFKVVFETTHISQLFVFNEVAYAISEGGMLGVSVGSSMRDAEDHRHLVIKVLPSAPVSTLT